jgi:transposase
MTSRVCPGCGEVYYSAASGSWECPFCGCEIPEEQGQGG